MMLINNYGGGICFFIENKNENNTKKHVMVKNKMVKIQLYHHRNKLYVKIY